MWKRQREKDWIKQRDLTYLERAIRAEPDYRSLANKMDKLDEQLASIQASRREIYSMLRDSHGRVVADAFKTAVNLRRMDAEKRARTAEIDAEAFRILGILADLQAPGATNARENIEGFPYQASASYGGEFDVSYASAGDEPATRSNDAEPRASRATRARENIGEFSRPESANPTGEIGGSVDDAGANSLSRFGFDAETRAPPAMLVQEDVQQLPIPNSPDDESGGSGSSAVVAPGIAQTLFPEPRGSVAEFSELKNLSDKEGRSGTDIDVSRVSEPGPAGAADLPKAVVTPISAPSQTTLRPYCKNREQCGGYGRKHCYSCLKAAGLPVVG